MTYSKRKRRRKKQQRGWRFFWLLLLFLTCGTLYELSGDGAETAFPAKAWGKLWDWSGQEQAAPPLHSVSGELSVHFLDVGQGDAILILCGGQAMLIDAGDNSQGTRVQLYLEKQGVTKLDYVIGTHPDADHIGGLDVIITKFDCGRILMPDVSKDSDTYRDVLSAMDYRGYQNTLPVTGSVYELGEAFFTIVSLEKEYEDVNDASVGILLTHGNNRFLFTGDAGEEAEQDMLRSGLDLKADVWKAAHHGSSTSNSRAFLEAVSPKAAVISCGEGNSYGHPHAEVLNRFREMGISVYRTDEQGTVAAVSDGEEIRWNCAPSESWLSG